MAIRQPAMCGSLRGPIGVVLSRSLTSAQMESFGWRIPLLVGFAIIPFLFLLRRSLAETDEFLAGRIHPSTGQIMSSLRANWKFVLRGTLLVTMTTVSFYMITTYTPTFGRSMMHLTDRDSLIVILCVGISNFVWLPLSGALSDRIGRRPILIVCTLLAILTAYPALAWAVAAPSFSRPPPCRIVAVVPLRWLQRSDDCPPHRDHAAPGSRLRILARL